MTTTSDGPVGRRRHASLPSPVVEGCAGRAREGTRTGDADGTDTYDMRASWGEQGRRGSVHSHYAQNGWIARGEGTRHADRTDPVPRLATVAP